MAKSRVLVIGATGNLGYHIANASLEASHPTFALVRDSAFSDAHKSAKLQHLSDRGAVLLKGSIEDKEILLDAVKRVDVVISAVSAKQVPDQRLIIQAIKQAGCIKKFIPAEFGLDPDKVQISDSEYNFYTKKAEIRRLIEAEGIPHTYISNNLFTSILLPSLVQPGLPAPPRDKVEIFGDGNVKGFEHNIEMKCSFWLESVNLGYPLARLYGRVLLFAGVFVKEVDVAAFTICAVDDPRTLNKVVYLRPKGNMYSMNELVELWEMKIGKKLERTYLSGEELLRRFKENPWPKNLAYLFIESAFIKGDHTYFDIESSDGVEGTQLYPHIKYTTISEYLDTLL